MRILLYHVKWSMENEVKKIIKIDNMPLSHFHIKSSYELNVEQAQNLNKDAQMDKKWN